MTNFSISTDKKTMDVGSGGARGTVAPLDFHTWYR